MKVVWRTDVSWWVMGMVLSLSAAAAAAPRSQVVLDKSWHFIRQDVPRAQVPEFDDSTWQTVDVPHTWNNLDGQDGGNNYYRGPAWYRRHLKLESQHAGQSLFLRFEGAAALTDVFVNGQPAGAHRGSFGAFCFDVSKMLKPGADNVIAVRVDNTYLDDVPPLGGDFTIFGGLYRNVSLLVLDPLSISPLDDASPGVYLKQTRVDENSADVEITTKLRNASAAGKVATVVCTIADAEGKVVQSATAQQQVDAASTADSVQKITIPHPHLWHGRADPYLYRATITVQDGQRITDQVTQPLGLRFFRVVPDHGFFLNGRPYPLHGVNRHQDRLDKGWAIGPAEHDEDFALLREMGCTAVRLAHYQQADYFYSLCDRGGMVVWAELAMVNGISNLPSLSDNARQQLRELIKQNYNHPSICFWSLFNELHFPNRQQRNPDDWRLVNDLNDLAHQLDPTRLTCSATDLAPEHPVNWITDLAGFNKYCGWYSGPPSNWPRFLDDLHNRFPDRRIAITEYGAGASINQHENPPQQPKHTVTPWHPEEWQCVVHEAAWGAMKDRPWLWGTFIWNMFDFASDWRHEGDHAGRNDKGLVTYDRKTRKDAFYFYQASWTDTPVVHITSRRFSPRPAGEADVKVYSNCDSVELLVNNKSLGTKSSPDHIVLWPGVTLIEGANNVHAVGRKDGKQFEDACTWMGEKAPVAQP